jgi:hypothetical protein
VKKFLERAAKKINNIMAGYDIDELMSVKNGYMGQTFQWIKTNDMAKLGKVVTVNDVVPGNRQNVDGKMVQRYVVRLSDGTNIDSELANSYLMMVLDDQPPLNMAEIQSINMGAPPIDAQEIISSLPADLQATSTIQTQVRQPESDPAQPQYKLTRDIPAPITPAAPKPEDLFGQFSLEDTDLSLLISVQLPSKAFLKMMYANSQDKDLFLNQLSAYINNKITPDSIKDSITKMMGPDKKK